MRILIALMLFTSVAFGQGAGLPAQGPPPKNLTRQADGRFSANSDPANPEKFEVRTVVKGDTLSEIAGEVLKDPRLWPQLWEQNEHIVNPHWIYPDDKILIRPITQITEAAPPPEPAPDPGPPNEAAPEPTPVLRPTTIEPQAQPQAQNTFQLTPPAAAPEVKVGDLYCSGFIRTAPLGNPLKVIAKFEADSSALAVEPEYIYLSRGAVGGVRVGDMFQVVRPTKEINSPARRGAERDRGRHYLDVAQIRVVLVQPEFSLARVIHSCEAAEIGDVMIPFQRIELPPIARPRPFSPFMGASGQARGVVISTKDGLLNFGSSYKASEKTPGVRHGHLSVLERGMTPQGGIAYVDVGQPDGVRPGDVFIVFRNIDLDNRLYNLPSEARVLRNHRTAIGEMIILKVDERASTALVTYATDAISLGDAVERR